MWWIPSFLLPELFLVCQVEPPAFPCLCSRNSLVSSANHLCLFYSIPFSLLLMFCIHHAFRFLLWIFCCFSACFLSRRGLGGSTLHHPLPCLLGKDYKASPSCCSSGPSPSCIARSLESCTPSQLFFLLSCSLSACPSWQTPAHVQESWTHFSRRNLTPFSKRSLCSWVLFSSISKVD